MSTGGYPIAFQASTSTLNDILWFLHSTGDIPSKTTQTVDSMTDANGADPARLILDVSIEAPTLKFDSRSDGNLGAVVTGVVKLTIDRFNGPPSNHLIHLRLDLAVAMQARVDFLGTSTIGGILDGPNRYNLVLSLTPVLVETSEVRLLGGEALTNGWRAFFTSAKFRTGLGFLLSQQLASISNALPPDAAPILNSLGLEQGAMTAIAVAGNRFVTVCVSIEVDDFHLNGDPLLVADFRDGWDTALCIDNSTEGLLASTVVRAAGEAENPPDLSNIAVEMHTGYLQISGHAELTGGSADFRFQARPRLGRPDSEIVWQDQYGSWTEFRPGDDDQIWVEVIDAQLDVSADWWVWLLLTLGWSVLGPAPGAFLVYLFQGIITGAKIGVVGQASSLSFPSRHQRIVNPANGAIALDITIGSLKLRPAGMTARARIRLEAPETRLVGPFWLDVMSLFEDRQYDIIVSPRTVNLDDPSLMLHWRVYKGGTNDTVVDFVCGPGMSAWSSLVVNWLAFGTGHEAINSFVIDARVYRSGEGQKLHVARQDVVIGDRLNRGYRFVQWTHPVHTFWVEKSNGIPVASWWQQIVRTSQLHRTDVPGRCRFAWAYSEKAVLSYSDHLGFPWSDLPKHRDKVCEYCFFGGPDKIVPVAEPTHQLRPKGEWVDLRGKLAPKSDSIAVVPKRGSYLRRGKAPVKRSSRPPR